MALHEHFSEYTSKEILEIKKDICQANKCPYLGTVHDSSKPGTKYATANKCCNYLLYTGHMRKCMPDDCTYYKDDLEKVKHMKFAR